MGGSLKQHIGAAAPSLGSEVWVLPKGRGLWRFPLKRRRNYSLKEATEGHSLWRGEWNMVKCGELIYLEGSLI